MSDPSSAAVNSVHKKELHARYRQEFFIKHGIDERSLLRDRLYEVIIQRTIRIIMRLVHK